MATVVTPQSHTSVNPLHNGLSESAPESRVSSFQRAPAPTDVVVHRTGNSAAPAERQGQKTTADIDRWGSEARPTEPRASASGRRPRVNAASDSLTLAVLCWPEVEFFMGFRGPKAHSNRPRGLSHIASATQENHLAESASCGEFPESQVDAQPTSLGCYSRPRDRERLKRPTQMSPIPMRTRDIGSKPAARSKLLRAAACVSATAANTRSGR
jgi:hypothetical protein